MTDTYTHYGTRHYEPDLFHPIRNSSCINKPAGGFWATPDSADCTWKDWCRKYDSSEEALNPWHPMEKSFHFRLKRNSRILELCSMQDVLKIPKKYFLYNAALHPQLQHLLDKPVPEINTETIWQVGLDYEKLQKEYDALIVWYTKDPQFKRYFLSWDLDSILILNPYSVLPADSKSANHTWHHAPSLQTRMNTCYSWFKQYEIFRTD